MKTFIVGLMASIGGFFGYQNIDVLRVWLGMDAPPVQVQPAIKAVEDNGFELARTAVKEGHLEKASGLYLKLLESAPTREQARQELAQAYATEGLVREGLTVEYRWAASEADRGAALARIRQYNLKVLNPADPTGGMRHVIQPNETLAKIAKKHGSNERLLKRINNIENPHRIHAGRALKVVPFKASIDVSLEARELVVCNEQGIWDVYAVGVGHEDTPSPTGSFVIEVLQIDPPYWHEPGKPPVPAGNPHNPLGSRWMGFRTPYESFGIHGTNDEASVGHRSSKGCMRLTKKDVEELFDLVDYGTEVTIRER
ncbi:MAG: L,D-transpeptidase family protein [Planctomycetota bacterium]